MTVIKALFQNFTWIDGIIIVIGLTNLFFVRARTKDLAVRLREKLNPSLNAASWRDEEAEHLAAHVKAKSREMAEEEQALLGMRRETERWYSWYVTVTAIFPLLGIFGTVYSLIPMVGELADMQQNFFTALTSTFWGLVFAIACKAFDAPLSALIEDNSKNIDIFVARKPREKQRETVTL